MYELLLCCNNTNAYEAFHHHSDERATLYMFHVQASVSPLRVLCCTSRILRRRRPREVIYAAPLIGVTFRLNMPSLRPSRTLFLGCFRGQSFL
jgi:hypothetical protein